MGISIDLGCDTGEEHWLESNLAFDRWADNALADLHDPARIDLLLASSSTMTDLNRRFRGIGSDTNVLAFPCPEPPEADPDFIGDVALCMSVVAREAQAQGKSLEDHSAHLLTHGLLHLLGFDHQTPEQASRMESEEVRILAKLGIADPYVSSASRTLADR